MSEGKTWRERQELNRRRKLVASIILGVVCVCMVAAGVTGGIIAINHAHAARNLGVPHADNR